MLAAADVYFALTYEGGRCARRPTRTDAELLELFNRHQLGDKGFGAALGPTAGLHAVDSFVARGYRVASRTSDWRHRPECRGVPARAARGLARRGARDRAGTPRTLEAWHRRRVAHVDAGSRRSSWATWI